MSFVKWGKRSLMYSMEQLSYLRFLQHPVQEVRIFASMKPFLSVHSNGTIKTRSHYQNGAEINYCHYHHQGGRHRLPCLNISKLPEIKTESNLNFLSMRSNYFSKFSLRRFGHRDWDEYMTTRLNSVRSNYVPQSALALFRQSCGHLISPKSHQCNIQQILFKLRLQVRHCATCQGHNSEQNLMALTAWGGGQSWPHSQAGYYSNYHKCLGGNAYDAGVMK